MVLYVSIPDHHELVKDTTPSSFHGGMLISQGLCQPLVADFHHFHDTIAHHKDPEYSLISHYETHHHFKYYHYKYSGSSLYQLRVVSV